MQREDDSGRPEDGDVYGNYNCVFQYPDGIDVTFSSTQFSKGAWDVTERFFGTEGNVAITLHGTTGNLGRAAVASAAGSGQRR